jgi:hypothetical protein
MVVLLRILYVGIDHLDNDYYIGMRFYLLIII